MNIDDLVELMEYFRPQTTVAAHSVGGLMIQRGDSFRDLEREDYRLNIPFGVYLSKSRKVYKMNLKNNFYSLFDCFKYRVNQFREGIR